MRGVTCNYIIAYWGQYVISTHTPHARRDIGRRSAAQYIEISTHTPHARRDCPQVNTPYIGKISTHTPHARRDDDINELKAIFNNDFNSHASCEA